MTAFTVDAKRIKDLDRVVSLTDQLLDILHRGGSWWYTWVNYKHTQGGSSYWQQVGDPRNLKSQIKGADGRGLNVYFSVHPLKCVPTTNTAGQAVSSVAARGRTEHIAAINCLYADIDAKDHGGTVESALAYAHSLSPAPSVVVVSGYGIHCYWLLDAPLMLTDGDSLRRAQYCQREWVRFVGADSGAKDLARILRLPGTDNWKGTTPVPVYIERHDFSRLYKFVDLESLLPPMPTVETAPKYTPTSHAAEVIKARRALSWLDPSRRDEYPSWIEIGMSLVALGDDGFELWKEWSKQSGKYKDGDCEHHWPTFSLSESLPPGFSRVTLGTLHYRAQQDYDANPNKNARLDAVLAGLNRHSSADDKFKAIDELVAELQRHPERIRRLYRLKAKQSGIPLADFDEAAKDAIKDQPTAEKDEESAHREIAEALLRDKPDMVRSAGVWYIYQDGIWLELDDERVDGYLIQISDALGIPTSASTIGGAHRIAKALAKVIDPNGWNPSPSTLVCRNGTLDIDPKTGKATLREHSPADLARVKLELDYDPAADCPVYKRVLRENLRGKGLVWFWLGICGLALVEDGRFEMSPWLKGPAGGGKSTVLEGLVSVLGGYAGHLHFEMMMTQAFGLEVIIDKKLVYSTEVSARYLESGSKANMLISQEAVAINRKYKPVVMYVPRCIVVYAMNDIPATGSPNDGIFRRIKPIHIQGRPAEKQDKSLRLAIRDDPVERAGMLNLMLEGLRRVRASGKLDVPDLVQVEVKEWQSENDKVGRFVELHCKVHPAARVTLGAMYHRFRGWVAEEGTRPVSRPTFAKQLGMMGFRRLRGNVGPADRNVVYFEGLELVDPGPGSGAQLQLFEDDCDDDVDTD